MKKETWTPETVNKYEYWMAGLVQLPGRKKIRLKEKFPDLEELYRLPEGQVRKLPFLTVREQESILEGRKGDGPDAEAERCKKGKIRLTCWGDARYPEKLRHIYDPPYGLYYRGSLPEEGTGAVAVVGARGCTPYGREMARGIGGRLARAGVSVISGMALGIDGAGHRGALQAGGRTYAVLGCGVDVCYPAQHRDMYEELVEKGGVISEYPPHASPLPMFFPQRNRLISAFSDCVVVVEARKRSGSLITADFALEQGKEVYAVPGRVGDALSEGTNRLIRQGAGIFSSWEDFREEMGILEDAQVPSGENEKKSLEKMERLVYSCVDLNPRDMEELLERTGISIAELMGCLDSLQEKGYVSEVYKNYFIRAGTRA